jgi:pSer/pThr/pTyr-binding forkhead associated (FHA) protein
MPPVNSAPSSEVDNEATAELPVLDVAAYEATLNGEEEAAHTDTWVLPSSTFTSAPLEATTEMPAVRLDAVPTLTKGVPAYDLDHSGTHEMPPLPQTHMKGRKAQPAKPAISSEALAPVTAAQTAPQVPAPIVVPPSPPLIEELRGALARAERRIEELQERARIADAERAVAIARANAECQQLREQLGAQLEALSTTKERLGVRGKDQKELVAALDARGDRIAALERELTTQAGVLKHTQALLAASEQRAEILDCDGQNLRATVARRNAQIQMLEADMQARQEREALLSGRLTEALASINPDVPRLNAEIAAREEKLRALKADYELLRAQSREKDSDLHVAEENIRQLESEVRSKTARLEEANVTVEEWRAVIAESQRSILQRDGRIQQLDARVQQLEADLQQQRFSSTLDTSAQTGEEPQLEGPARLLIRTDGNTDFVHVLGRRTRIGRGPDNELVLDTKHVSRYHAVLLAGPVSTSIEDLNSTNGVFVNGKRITRQVLKDGDKVTVGKTQFRYNVRD